MPIRNASLPPRPSLLQWYFETFCGIDREQFVRARFDELDATHDIKSHLDGFVKP